MTRNAIFLLFTLILTACGGGSGGGSSSSNSSNDTTGTGGSALIGGNNAQTNDTTDYDLNFTVSDRRFTTYLPDPLQEQSIDRIKLEMTAKYFDGFLYTFDPNVQPWGHIDALAGSNNDATIWGFIVDPTNQTDSYMHITAQGNESHFMPRDIRNFKGNFGALDAQGHFVGHWPIEITIDPNQVFASRGQNLGLHKAVEIVFNRYEGHILYATIWDPNRAFHSAELRLYGPTASTLAGGYADYMGIGILVAEAK